MGGRGSSSSMGRGGSSAGRASAGGGSITSLMAKADKDPLMNPDIKMTRSDVKDYFDMIGYTDYDERMLDLSAGMYLDQLEGFTDVKRAMRKATALPKTGDPIMDNASNVKDYYMATMADPGDSRATMNKFWKTTPGKVALAEFMRGEVEYGLTGREMKSVINSMKKRR